MRSRFFFALVLVTLTAARPTLAQQAAPLPPTACVDAASKGQKLRHTRQLVDARAAFTVCAAAGCPSVVQRDCVTWLAEIEKSLPSVVVTAKNGAGADLVDVRVSVDGKLLTTRLDGGAVPLDPGPHAFHFEGTDGSTLDRQVVVGEGDQNHAVSVVLGAVAATPSVGTTGAASGGPWKTAGWVVGGVGVAGLVVGAAFGAIALADKGSDCAGDVCKAGTIPGLRTTSLVSTAGLVAGGVLAAGGASLLLFGPHGSTEGAGPATGFTVTPVVTANGGAIVSGWRF